MSRTKKAIIWIAAALCLTVVFAYLLFGWAFWFYAGKNKESVSETPVTPELVNSMRADGFPVTISRVVSASSYGGLHGDGSSLTAYRYSPDESAALVAALQQKHPEFVWSEMRSEFATSHRASLKLLPPELLPESGASIIFVGRPKGDIPFQEYIVDRSRGLLYIVSNTF